MRYASINKCDVVNGQGIACSLFVQGCAREPHCKGCFNESSWDFNGGQEWTKEVEDDFIKTCKKEYINSVSIIGGEPMDNARGVYLLTKRIKEEVNKPIYLWTSYTYEEIMNADLFKMVFEETQTNDYRRLIMDNIDCLIDGRFIEEQKDLTLKLRGSSNQRIWRNNNGTWYLDK